MTLPVFGSFTLTVSPGFAVTSTVMLSGLPSPLVSTDLTESTTGASVCSGAFGATISVGLLSLPAGSFSDTVTFEPSGAEISADAVPFGNVLSVVSF